MSTKIAIEVDRGLFQQLKKYAQLTGHTISEVVEKQLKGFLDANEKDLTKPVSSKLRGIIKLPDDFDYKKEMFRIQAEMQEIMEQEKKSQQMLEDAFRGIGYGIE